MLHTAFNLTRPCSMGLMTPDRMGIEQARNLMAAEALEHGYDYLFFIDDDNPVPRDTLVKFLEDDKDIVCAPILKRRPDKNGQHPLCVFYMHMRNDIRLYEPVTQFRDEGYLHKIDACGMGCTLIKRKVLEAVDKKYPGKSFQMGNLISYHQGDGTIDIAKGLKRTMSEDLEFCERATDAGFEIWCDTRIRPLHQTGLNYVQWQEAEPENVNTSSYWDKVWEREGNDTWRKYPLTFEKIKGIVTPQDEVLDVGCGVGVLLDVLKPVCKKVAGIDISSKAIEILQSKGIEGKAGTLPKIDYPDKSFDVVVATETLEHLDCPDSLIQEMIRVARQKVIISVPDNCLGPNEEKEHRQMFTAETLNQMLSHHFKDVRIETFRDNFSSGVNISLPTLLAVCENPIPTIECNPDMMGVKV